MESPFESLFVYAAHFNIGTENLLLQFIRQHCKIIIKIYEPEHKNYSPTLTVAIKKKP